MAAAAALTVADGAERSLSQAEMASYPVGRLDESAQPLDLSEVTSWSRRLGDVSTAELLHTMAANTVAPFVMVGWLRSRLAPSERDPRFGHVLNVSALEGKVSPKPKPKPKPKPNPSPNPNPTQVLTTALVSLRALQQNIQVLLC